MSGISINYGNSKKTDSTTTTEAAAALKEIGVSSKDAESIVTAMNSYGSNIYDYEWQKLDGNNDGDVTKDEAEAFLENFNNGQEAAKSITDPGDPFTNPNYTADAKKAISEIKALLDDDPSLIYGLISGLEEKNQTGLLSDALTVMGSEITDLDKAKEFFTKLVKPLQASMGNEPFTDEQIEANFKMETSNFTSSNGDANTVKLSWLLGSFNNKSTATEEKKAEIQTLLAPFLKKS